MGKMFGTDGVRGVANGDLTPELAFQLGRAGAWVLTQGKSSWRERPPHCDRARYSNFR